VADVRIFVDGEGVLTDTPPRAADAWLGMLRKYVNPRLAPYRDESQALRCVGVFGPRARDVMEHATGIGASALGLLPMYAHVQVQDGDDALLVARTPELAVDGFEVFASPAACDRLWARAVAAHAVPCGLTAWDIARVEAGRPEWGVDMDDTTIPQEANFDELQAISYTKGCYVGQEVVARLHFRGHTNRNLRGLRAAGSAPPPTGATLVDPAGKAVGDVRSAVSSPRLGGIALAMIRREVEMGTTLTAAWDGGEMHVDVVPLPFPTE
jgi:folate-binding protein YgfZ